MRVFLALVAATLPARWWTDWEGWLPIRALAGVSGLLTMFGGFAAGIPGFFRYADEFTRTVQLAVASSDTPEAFPNMLLGPLAPLNFALGTPLGLATTYFCLSGGVRAVLGYFDDPRGDPVLTAVDHVLLAGRTRIADAHARRTRLHLEGPETPDRLVTGVWAGVDADYVLLASRRKPEWEEGLFVMSSEAWYRVGRPWDMPRPEGLRTAYPLTVVPRGAILRKGVEYELPDVPQG